MRLLIATTASFCLLFASSVAGAYEINVQLVSGDPANATEGDQFSYDIFLNTEGQSDIVLLSVGVQFDPDIVGFNRAMSDAEDYYPLYAYPIKGVAPATWLNPLGDPFRLWAGDQPPNGDKVIQIDFVANGFEPTQATSSAEYLGTLSFNAVSAGSTTLTLFFDQAAYGHIFELGDGSNVSGSVTLNLPDGAVTVPEPAMAVLGLAALGTVGALARRKRRV